MRTDDFERVSRQVLLYTIGCMSMLIPVKSQSQTQPATAVIEHPSATRSYSSPLYIVYTEKAHDSQEELIKKRLFEASLGLEVIVHDQSDYQVAHVKDYITDAINFGRTEPEKVFILDLTSGFQGTRALVQQIPGKIGKVLAFGRFDRELYQAMPGDVRILPKTRLANYDIAGEVWSYFNKRRKWGFEVSENQTIRDEQRKSRIAAARRGMIYMELQRGTWFLLPERSDDDHGRYQIKGSGSVYRLDLGYGLTERWVVKAGLNLSFERPNEDELAQQSANIAPTPGVPVSHQVKDHFFVSPFVGVKYRLPVWKGKVQPYFHLAYEQVNIELFNLRMSINGAGQPRNRLSTDSKRLNSARFGSGLEAQFHRRIYFNLQIDAQTTESLDETISGVSNLNNLSFQFGFSFKLGNPGSPR